MSDQQQPAQAQAAAEESKGAAEETKGEEEKVAPKHTALAASQPDEGVEIMENRFTRNITSPFINQKKAWDEDTDFISISPELIKGIVEELGFIKPSKIQAVAIPMIQNNQDGVYFDLIAQSKNGSGKTGAFAIGSTLRVDPTIMKPQVLVVCHVRELASQIAEVYTKLTKFTNINVSNLLTSGKTEGQHIVVTTLGKLANILKGRKAGIDLSELRCFVVDETDVFFGEQRNLDQLREVHTKYISKLPKKVQFIFFSATYTEEVSQAISTMSTQAQMIRLKKEQLQLDHISQYEFRCAQGKKPDFIKQVFDVCEMTQTVIFVNTKAYAERLFQMMRRANYKATIIFGDMMPNERDEMIEKFRNGEISVIITTNLLARGIDVPEVQIVVNFDVPTQTVNRQRSGDAENYLHRIGRTGRFGTRGIALTIYDRDEDKTYLDQILDNFAMREKMTVLESPETLRGLLEEIRAETV